MPVLPNPRHERFAQELAKGKSATEAYETAGYRPNEGNAGRLNRNEQVRTRVAQLQGKASVRAEVTLESLMSEAEEARQLAMATKQPAAAVSALTAKGKLAGLWVEKRETLNKHVDPDSIPDGELADIAATGRERPAQAPSNPSKLN